MHKPVIFALIGIGFSILIIVGMVVVNGESRPPLRNAKHAESSGQSFVNNRAISNTLETRGPNFPKSFDQSAATLRNDPSDITQLPEETSKLKDFDRTEQESINDVFVLLHSLRSANQGDLPTGINVEVVNALLGKNFQRVAYLSERHPRINKFGELIDKWGTPYDFHFLSSKEVEIRSAGPDKQVYTADDVVHQSR